MLEIEDFIPSIKCTELTGEALDRLTPTGAAHVVFHSIRGYSVNALLPMRKNIISAEGGLVTFDGDSAGVLEISGIFICRLYEIKL